MEVEGLASRDSYTSEVSRGKLAAQCNERRRSTRVLVVTISRCRVCRGPRRYKSGAGHTSGYVRKTQLFEWLQRAGCWLHAPHLIRMTRFQNSPRFGKNDVMSWNVSNCMRSCVAKDTTLGKRGSFRPDECRILNPLSSQRVNFKSVSRPASESLNGVHIHVPNEIGRKTGEEGHGRYCASSI
jgi:hypothetical protein